MWLERTVLYTSYKFPGILCWFEVTNSDKVSIEPLAISYLISISLGLFYPCATPVGNSWHSFSFTSNFTILRIKTLVSIGYSTRLYIGPLSMLRMIYHYILKVLA